MEPLSEELRRRIAANIDAMRADGDWCEYLLDDLAKAPLVPEEPTLTRSEVEVLKCISRGLTLAEAAVALGRGVETVKTQAGTARQRLAAKTTAQAACQAIRIGLIP